MNFNQLMEAYHINDDLCNRAVYDELLAQMKKNCVTPVVGAGLSRWAGYPLWKELLEQKAKGLPNEKTIHQYINQEKFEKAASMIEKAHGRNRFRHILEKEYSPDKLSEKKRPEYQRLFSKLFPGPVITTNFDISLERILGATFHFTPEDTFQTEACKNHIQQKKPALIKLHGSVSDSAHMILTEDRYNEAYGEDENTPDLLKPLPDILRTAFSAAPPLFLGCGLGADRTGSVLKACVGAEGYALVEMPKATENILDPLHPIIVDGLGEYVEEFQNRYTYLDDMKLRVIWYPYGQHEAVETFINQLAADMKVNLAEAGREHAITTWDKEYQVSSCFIGREKDVETVADKVASLTKPVLVHGPNGIGKTEVCKAAYHLLKKRIDNFCMPYLNLKGTTSIPSFLEKVAVGLDVPTHDGKQYTILQSIVEKVKLNRGNIEYAVFLDNYDDFYMTLSEQDQGEQVKLITELTKQGLRVLLSSAVVISGTETIPVLPLDGAVNVYEMSKEEVYELNRVRLFLHVLGRSPMESEYASLLRLADELGGHPQSIICVARYGRDCKTIDELLSLLEKMGEDQEIAKMREEMGRNFQLAWDEIIAQNNQAAILYGAVHAFSKHPLDVDLMEGICKGLENKFGKAEWIKGGMLLRKYAMISCSRQGTEIMLLPFKRMLISACENENIDIREAYSSWARFVGNAFKYGMRTDLSYKVCFEPGVKWLPQCWHLLQEGLRRGYYKEIEEMLSDSWEYLKHDVTNSLKFLQRITEEKKFSDAFVGHAWENLGDIYSIINKIDEALNAYVNAENKYRLLGDKMNYIDLAYVIWGQGSIYERRREKGDFEKGLIACQNAKSIYEIEKSKIGCANVLRLRGDLLTGFGVSLDEAQTCYEEAEKLYSQEGSNVGRASVMTAKGRLMFFTDKSRTDEAKKLLFEAENLYELKNNNLGRGEVNLRLGEMEEYFEHWEEAIERYEAAMEFYRLCGAKSAEEEARARRIKCCERAGKPYTQEYDKMVMEKNKQQWE